MTRHRVCTRCKGEGRIPVAGYSINPRTGIRGRDPQCDTDAVCPDCCGEGVIPDGNEPLPKELHDELVPRGFL